MKTYALTVKTFNELSEIVETVDYLKHSFPGLMNGSYIDNYLDKSVPDGEKLQQCKLATILAFNEFYTSNNRREDEFRNAYENHEGDEEIQQILFEQYTVTEKHLDNKSVDIDFAVNQKLIVEVKLIALTVQEKRMIVKSLETRQDFSMAENNMAESIINKLK